MSGKVQVHHAYVNLSFLSICPVVNGTGLGSFSFFFPSA